MKKTILCSVAMIALIAYTTFAKSFNNDYNTLNQHNITTHVCMQGQHCSGTVGCNCPGFSPITNGDVWQQSYCRHCGHKKSYHR
ncbi:MAG: hypothetical protein LUC88_03345 [Prevotella sp.]|nr:hypothetical protein [Prevotella sp.]